MPAPTNDEDGPLGIKDLSADGWDWYYYFKTGRTLDEKQLDLVAKSSRLSAALREISRKPESESIMRRLKDLFSAVLVQNFRGEVLHYINEVSELENEFYRRVVTPAHQERLLRPFRLTGIGVAALLCGALLIQISSGYIYHRSIQNLQVASIDLGTIRAFLLVMSGCLLGRLIYYSISFNEAITTLPQYYNRAREVSHPAMTMLFDLLIGFAACLFFITGVIIVAFGGDQGTSTQNVDAAITSLMIKDNALLALVFGLLVGVARSEFIAKILGIAGGRTV